MKLNMVPYYPPRSVMPFSPPPPDFSSSEKRRSLGMTRPSFLFRSPLFFLAATLVALTAFVVQAAPAQAQSAAITLVSNLGQRTFGLPVGALSSDVNAIGFRTGSNTSGYALSSIEVETPDNPGDSTRSSIRAELRRATSQQSGPPAKKVADLTVPSSVSAGTVAFEAPADTMLAANTTYFFVLYTEGAYRFQTNSTRSSNLDTGGQQGWSILDMYSSTNTPGTWTVVDFGIPYFQKIRVKGAVLTLPPPVPTGLGTTPGNAKLDLDWEAPGNAVSYDVHYTSSTTVAADAPVQTGGSASAANGWVDAGHTGATSTHTISGLTNDTPYRVRVRGVNAEGDGPWAWGTGTPKATTSGSTDAWLLDLDVYDAANNLLHLQSSTYVFTVDVKGLIDRVTVTPKVRDSNATVKVNGMPVAIGSASGAIDLDVGPNTITIEVTAQAGNTRNYELRMNRAEPPPPTPVVVTLVSNVDQPATIPIRTNPSQSFPPPPPQTTAGVVTALRFNTEGRFSAGHTLSSIDVPIRATLNDTERATIRAQLWSEGVSGPDTKIKDLTLSPGMATGMVSFAAPEGTMFLEPNTRYYFVLYTTGDVDLRWDTTRSHNLDPGSQPRWGLSDINEYYQSSNEPTSGPWTRFPYNPHTDPWNLRIRLNGAVGVFTDPPAAPAGLGVTPGDTKLDLDWTAQDPVRSDVHYTSSTTVAADAPAQTGESASAADGWVDAGHRGDTASHRIRHLTNDTAYRVRVRGANVIGDGAWAWGTGTPKAATSDSTDARLSALSLNAAGGATIAFEETFVSTTYAYTANASNSDEEVTVTPTTNESNATVKVNGTPVAHGSASGAIDLDVGSNTITIEVTAQAGNTRSYTIRVNRATDLPTETIWSATLTVGDTASAGYGLKGLGCITDLPPGAPGQVRCSQVLSDDDFTHDGADYQIARILYYPLNDNAVLRFDDPVLPKDWVLQSGSVKLSFEDGNFSRSGTSVTWSRSGLGWSQGQSVSLSLLVPLTAPPVPAGLEVTPGDMKLGLEWTAPSEVESYDVHYTASTTVEADALVQTGASPSAADGWVDAGHTGTTTSHTIADLTNDTAYRVRVRGVNAAGDGAWAWGTGTPEAPADPVDLDGLVITGGLWSGHTIRILSNPFFDPDTAEYTIRVPYNLRRITFTPTWSDTAITAVVLKDRANADSSTLNSLQDARTTTSGNGLRSGFNPRFPAIEVHAAGRDPRVYYFNFQRTSLSFGGATVDDMTFTEGGEISFLDLSEGEKDALRLPVASGGFGNVTYEVTGLPEGLSFGHDRLIYGTPAAATTSPTEVDYTVTDGIGGSATLHFHVSVAPPVEFDADEIQTFKDTIFVYTVGQAERIEATLPEATGGHGTLTYGLTYRVKEQRTVDGRQITGGVVKTIDDDAPGFSFDADTRVLTSDAGGSAPSEEAFYSVDYWAEDENGARAIASNSIEVNEAPTLPEMANRSFTVGESVSVTLPKAVGGTAVGTGILYRLEPAVQGLVFNGRQHARTLSGTPQVIGTTEVTYTATDRNGVSATRTFTIEIVAGAGAPAAAPDLTAFNAATDSGRQIVFLDWPDVSGATGHVVQVIADGGTFPTQSVEILPEEGSMTVFGSQTDLGNGKTAQVLITSLNAGDYKARVAAVNGYGAGPWSNEAAFTVPAATQPPPQQIVGNGDNCDNCGTEGELGVVAQGQSHHADLIAQMYEWRNDPEWSSYKSHTDRWDRALLAFGETVSDTSLTPMTAAEAKAFADTDWGERWVPVAAALKQIESADPASLIAKMYEWRNDPQWVSYKSHTDRWDRALLAFGETVTDTTLTAMTAAEAQGYADRGSAWSRWVEVAAALQELESAGQQQVTATATPEPEAQETGSEETDSSDIVSRYDADGDGSISQSERLKALNDYYAARITYSEFLEVNKAYQAS